MLRSPVGSYGRRQRWHRIASEMFDFATIMTSAEAVNAQKSSVGERIPKTLRTTADRLVDSLKINSVSEVQRRSRWLVTKRRNVYGEPLARLSNVYFRVAGIPIRF